MYQLSACIDTFLIFQLYDTSLLYPNDLLLFEKQRKVFFCDGAVLIITILLGKDECSM